MNEQQLRALNRKRHVIATLVTWDGVTADQLRNRQLLTRNMKNEVDHLWKDTSNFSKMIKYLELLEANQKALGNPKTLFSRLAKFVGDRSTAVEDQLRTEYRFERGQLPVEGYLKAETRKLVGNVFTATMRSDHDRQDMECLIGARLQVNKEVWRHHILLAEKKLADMMASNAKKEVHWQTLLSKAQMFLSVHRNQLNESTIEVACLTLPQAVVCLLDLTDSSLMERNSRIHEKKLALNVLHPKVVTYGTKLEAEFTRSKQPIDDETDSVQMVLASVQQSTKQLTIHLSQICEDTEQQLAMYDNNEQNLICRLHQAALREQCSKQAKLRIERELEHARKAVTKQWSRCHTLDDTRKLGYMKKQSTDSHWKHGTEIPFQPVNAKHLSFSLDLPASRRISIVNKKKHSHEL